MQVVSGAVYAPRVHFEAPPSERVQAEMERFRAWFEDTAPTGTRPLPALTRAGLAHLWFESIHPFEDGNGRIGRAIAEKALAQVEFIIGKARLLERVRGKRNARQEKAVLRMFAAGPEGFTGGLSAGNLPRHRRCRARNRHARSGRSRRAGCLVPDRRAQGNPLPPRRTVETGRDGEG
jgi:hypothetical protein